MNLEDNFNSGAEKENIVTINNKIEKTKKNKGKTRKIFKILLIIFILLSIVILIYYFLFYNKTIMYKCSNNISEEYYTLWKEDNNCKFYSILDCKNCRLVDDSKDGMIILWDEKINGHILYDYENKKKVNEFENETIKFVFNDGSLYGYIFTPADNMYSLSFYNLDKQKTTYVLEQSSGFESGSKMNQIEEREIFNNLIIAYKSVLDNKDYYEEKDVSEYEYANNNYYGIVDLETGNIVVPFENVSLERTTYGNFKATRIGGYLVYYDEYGEVIIRSCAEDEEFKPHYSNFVDVIEISNDLFLVDLDYSYFDIIDNKGNSLLNEKISRASIENDIINLMDNQNDIELFKYEKHNFDIRSYPVGNNKYNIACSYSVEDRYYTISYEFDLEKGTLKKIL